MWISTHKNEVFFSLKWPYKRWTRYRATALVFVPRADASHTRRRQSSTPFRFSFFARFVFYRRWPTKGTTHHPHPSERKRNLLKELEFPFSENSSTSSAAFPPRKGFRADRFHRRTWMCAIRQRRFPELALLWPTRVTSSRANSCCENRIDFGLSWFRFRPSFWVFGTGKASLRWRWLPRVDDVIVSQPTYQESSVHVVVHLKMNSNYYPDFSSPLESPHSLA